MEKMNLSGNKSSQSAEKVYYVNYYNSHSYNHKEDEQATVRMSADYIPEKDKDFMEMRKALARKTPYYSDDGKYFRIKSFSRMDV